MSSNVTDALESADTFIADTPGIREFIMDARAALAHYPGDAASGLRALTPRFSALLSEAGWLPEQWAQSCPGSGMGGGIGQWLLFRAGDASLTLFSLVVPPGSATPVHDHLAWGLVGLYRGLQEETVYRRIDHGGDEGRAVLEVAEARILRPGESYTLLPPDGDIHAVKTISDVPSVSIHLLGNDTGCTWRHAFDPDHEAIRRFRSGYSNFACREEE